MAQKETASIKIGEKYYNENLSQTWSDVTAELFLSFISYESLEEKQKVIKEEEEEARQAIEGLNISLCVKDGFSQKALETSLPNRPTYQLFKHLSKLIDLEEVNSSLRVPERRFALINAFLNKYPYKIAVNETQITEWDLYNYSKMGMNVKHFDTIIKRDEEYIEFFTRRSFIYNENIEMFLIPFVYSFVYMSKLEDPILNLVMKRTKEDFKELLLKMTEESIAKNICSLYTPRGLRSQELTKEIKKIFSNKYFKQDSIKYKTLPPEMRKQIADNYFEHMLLEQTVYKDSKEYQENEEPQKDESVVPVYNKMAEVFNLRKV